jgi:hypothetical protein
MEAKEYTLKITWQQRRAELKEKSEAVRGLVERGEFDCINSAILEVFYKKDGHQEFNTLKQWNKLGYRVIKGSTSFTVWGAPVAKSKDTPPATNTDSPSTEEQKEDFWPMCYLFSNLQVKPHHENN